MRTNTFNEALAARSDAVPYLKQFQELYSSCKESATDVTKRKALAHTLAASQYRGLESLTFVETIRLNQRQAVQEILAAQEDFRDLLSSEELMSELQILSIKLSNCPSRLAYMFGVGDADEAFRISASQETYCTTLLCDNTEQHNIRQKAESHKSFGECINLSKYEI